MKEINVTVNIIIGVIWFILISKFTFIIDIQSNKIIETSSVNGKKKESNNNGKEDIQDNIIKITGIISDIDDFEKILEDMKLKIKPIKIKKIDKCAKIIKYK